MGWLTQEKVKRFMIGKTIKEINNSWPYSTIVFTDGTAIRLSGCIDINNNLCYKGGSIKLEPYILATPLKLVNGKMEVVQLSSIK